MFGNKEKQKPDLEVFVIYDSKVGNYRLPIFAINKFDILREFDRTFADPKQTDNQYFTNAEDFAIFKIGEYSKQTGELTPVQAEHIANLHDIRTAVKQRLMAEKQQVGIHPT